MPFESCISPGGQDVPRAAGPYPTSGCCARFLLHFLLEPVLVVLAEDVRRPFQGMVANTPATLGVAVHLAHAGVDADAYRADKCGLTKVGAETGPEVVVDVRSTMKRPCVVGEPMADGGEEADHQRDHEGQDGDADHPADF